MDALKSQFNRLGRFQKYFYNSLWIMSERVIGMALTFVATVFVARALGPSEFGSLAYALSLTSIFGIAGHLGLSGLVVREIVKHEDHRGEILGTVFALKCVAMAFGYVSLVTYAGIYEGTESLEFSLIAICGLAILFKPAEAVDFWFQAFLKARYTSIARTFTTVITTILKAVLAVLGASVIAIGSAYFLHALILAALFAALLRAKIDFPLTNLSFNWSRAKTLLNQGALVFAGSIFAIVNLRVDQVMLRWLSGPDSVGTYAIAAQISEAWYFVPTAIVASFFPLLIKLHGSDRVLFDRRLQQLFDGLFLCSVLVASAVSFLAPMFINFFFREGYFSSSAILIVHIWAGVFVFMRAAFSKWILIEGMLRFSLITQGLGAFTNILLNFLFIPEHGGIGAAYATLFSYAMSGYFSLAFHPKTRPVFFQMSKALVSPIRYTFSLSRQYVLGGRI